MNKFLLLSTLMLLSVSAKAADFTVNFTPADASVTDQQVSGISQSKITNAKFPVTTKFTTTGAFSYTVPAGALYLHVRMVGGGGGGGGANQGASGPVGLPGSDSVFSDATAKGGFGGQGAAVSTSGGSFIIGSIKGSGYVGGTGGGYFFASAAGSYGNGGMGGVSPIFSGAGSAGIPNNAGIAGLVNTGGGGGGGATGSSGGAYGGAGGGSGGVIEGNLTGITSGQILTGLVGAGGSAGAGGTNGNGGGAGGSGTVEVTAFFQ